MPDERPVTPSESREHRLKRMQMRSWRRGMKEMDLVLGPFSDTELAGFDSPALDLFDRLLTENDQEIFTWITGQNPAPAAYADLIARLTGFAKTRLAR